MTSPADEQRAPRIAEHPACRRDTPRPAQAAKQALGLPHGQRNNRRTFGRNSTRETRHRPARCADRDRRAGAAGDARDASRRSNGASRPTGSPVTVADEASEAVILRRPGALLPGIPVDRGGTARPRAAGARRRMFRLCRSARRHQGIYRRPRRIHRQSRDRQPRRADRRHHRRAGARTDLARDRRRHGAERLRLQPGDGASRRGGARGNSYARGAAERPSSWQLAQPSRRATAGVSRALA